MKSHWYSFKGQRECVCGRRRVAREARANVFCPFTASSLSLSLALRSSSRPRMPLQKHNPIQFALVKSEYILSFALLSSLLLEIEFPFNHPASLADGILLCVAVSGGGCGSIFLSCVVERGTEREWNERSDTRKDCLVRLPGPGSRLLYLNPKSSCC